MLARQIEGLPTRSVRRLLLNRNTTAAARSPAVTPTVAVEIRSRRGTALTTGFPEVVAAVFAQLPPDTVVDGELVCCGDGKLDFGFGLQRRNGVG